MRKPLTQHKCQQIKKRKRNLKKYNKPNNINLHIQTHNIQISERYKPLHLISLINPDHAMFIWRGKPVLSFSKKCIKFIYAYQVTPSLTWNFFFIYFSMRVFLHRDWQFIGQQGKGGDHLIPLYHFHLLTNIETFFYNFAREMTITYF